VETDSKAKTAARSTHTPWLIAGAILFTTAASLEWLIARTHGVSVTSIHDHTIVPGAVHLLAAVSIPIRFVSGTQKEIGRPRAVIAQPAWPGRCHGMLDDPSTLAEPDDNASTR